MLPETGERRNGILAATVETYQSHANASDTGPEGFSCIHNASATAGVKNCEDWTTKTAAAVRATCVQLGGLTPSARQVTSTMPA